MYTKRKDTKSSIGKIYIYKCIFYYRKQCSTNNNSYKCTTYITDTDHLIKQQS